MNTILKTHGPLMMALAGVVGLGLATPALAQAPDWTRGPHIGPGSGGYAGGGGMGAQPQDPSRPGAFNPPGRGPGTAPGSGGYSGGANGGPAPGGWSHGGGGYAGNPGRPTPGPAPTYGYGGGGGYGGAPASGRGSGWNGDRGWDHGPGPGYHGGYGGGYAYVQPAPPRYAYAYGYAPPPPRVAWGPSYYERGVVIPAEAWDRRYAPPDYVYEEYAQPGVEPVLIDGTLFLVDAVTRTILDVINGGY